MVEQPIIWSSYRMLPTSYMGSSATERPEFDQALADDLVGKLVLVGLTHEDRRGEVKGLEQFFGTVSAIDPCRGIALSLQGKRSGETKWLPPDTRAFQRAGKRQYRLRSTREVVSNPDYTAQWTLVRPDG